MKKHDNIDPAPKPTPTEHKKAGIEAPQWLGRPISHVHHATQLEHDAAINEFRDRMPRKQAEDKAYEDYQRTQHIEAAAHHLAGMKTAHASGAMEAARKHGLMYNLHSKALGHEPVGPAHPGVVDHMNKKPTKLYGFKAHRGDLFALHGEKKPDAEAVTKSEALHALWQLTTDLVKAEDKHCENTKLCREHRPCSCACKACSKMPMTDDRDGKTYHKKLPPPEPAKKSLGDWAKSELAARKKLRTGKPKPCICTAYSHPHRHGGGKCGGKK